ncbi:MAG: hypothetical protein CMH52_02720 [Myxococcales bacterium]|nr:hypothetical protein [Myxococcales bacterium]
MNAQVIIVVLSWIVINKFLMQGKFTMKSLQIGLLFLWGALFCAGTYAQPVQKSASHKESTKKRDQTIKSDSEPKQATDAAKQSAPQSASPQPYGHATGASKAAPVDADWHGRAEKWFTSTDKKERRKAMRQFTRALRKPCRFCHTTDFKGYTDRLLISQQMMALTVEHGVECKDCHAGKDGFTKMGQISKKMWQLVHKKKVFCDNCHVPKTRFQTLTSEGKLFKDGGP